MANLSNLGFGMANTLDNTAYQRAKESHDRTTISRQSQTAICWIYDTRTARFPIFLRLGIIPAQGVTTESYQPGLMDYLKIPLAIYKYSNPVSAMMPY